MWEDDSNAEWRWSKRIIVSKSNVRACVLCRIRHPTMNVVLRTQCAMNQGTRRWFTCVFHSDKSAIDVCESVKWKCVNGCVCVHVTPQADDIRAVRGKCQTQTSEKFEKLEPRNRTPFDWILFLSVHTANKSSERQRVAICQTFPMHTSHTPQHIRTHRLLTTIDTP